MVAFWRLVGIGSPRTGHNSRLVVTRLGRDPASRRSLLATHRSGFRFSTASAQALACGPHCASLRSGRRESNSVCLLPKQVYYQHTPARIWPLYYQASRVANAFLRNLSEASAGSKAAAALHDLGQIAHSSEAVPAPEPHQATIHLPIPLPPLLKDIPLSRPGDLPHLGLMKI